MKGIQSIQAAVINGMIFFDNHHDLNQPTLLPAVEMAHDSYSRLAEH